MYLTLCVRNALILSKGMHVAQQCFLAPKQYLFNTTCVLAVIYQRLFFWNGWSYHVNILLESRVKAVRLYLYAFLTCFQHWFKFKLEFIPDWCKVFN